MGKHDLNGSLALMRANADQETFQNHYLAVDTNIFIDLAQFDALDYLSKSDRTIIVTTEVLGELDQHIDGDGATSTFARQAREWIDSNYGATVSTGHSLIQEFNSVTTGLRSALFPIGKGDGGGEESIRFFARKLGSSSAAVQLNDVMIMSHDAASSSATRTGELVVGATHATMDFVDLSTSLLVSGQLSPTEYLNNLNDFRVSPAIDERVQAWQDAFYNSRKKAVNVLDEIEASGSVKIPIFESDSEWNINWFNLGPGKVSNEYDQSDQIGYFEIGSEGTSRIVIGDQQVVIRNEQLVGVSVDSNSELEFGVNIKKLSNGKFGIELELDSSYSIGKVTDELPDPYCFPAGTLIETDLNNHKPIEDITVGYEVLAFDPSADNGKGKKVAKRVTQTDVPHFSGPTAMLVSGGYCRPDMATGSVA